MNDEINDSLTDSLTDKGLPIYDPFIDRKSDNFLPANQEAELLIHLAYILRDITTLFKILSKHKDSYKRRLFGKYIVIEWSSLDKNFTTLVNLIIGGRTEFPVSDINRDKLLEIWKCYKNLRKPHLKTLEKIRNQLGAHRDLLHASEIARLWDAINLKDLLDMCNSVFDFYNLAKNLNIYCWFRVQGNDGREIINFVQPLTWTYSDESEE